jgi:DNA-directed RNA polymerase subunit M/transcription elongation factor TFIIS
MSDFCKSLKNSKGDVIGLWVADPDDPNFQTLVEEFNAKEGVPGDLFKAFEQSSYRIVPNHYNKAGGAFLMFGSSLAPGEKSAPVSSSKPQSAQPRSANKTSDIEFDCPHCRTHIVVAQSGAGMELPCPRCSKKIIIPDPRRTVGTPKDGNPLDKESEFAEAIAESNAIATKIITSSAECPSCHSSRIKRRFLGGSRGTVFFIFVVGALCFKEAMDLWAVLQTYPIWGMLFGGKRLSVEEGRKFEMLAMLFGTYLLIVVVLFAVLYLARRSKRYKCVACGRAFNDSDCLE